MKIFLYVSEQTEFLMDVFPFLFCRVTSSSSTMFVRVVLVVEATSFEHSADSGERLLGCRSGRSGKAEEEAKRKD